MATERLIVDELDTGGLTPGMARPPADVEHSDGYVAAWDGEELYWQSWAGSAAPRAVICVMHGFGEHSARYHHIAAAFVRSGAAAIAIDARGHGRSAGARGHVERFELFPRDLDLLIGIAKKRWPDAPIYVYGHSNGGLIALHHALMAPGRVRAYAVTSPFCGFKVKVPAAKAAAGHLMSRILPTLALPTDIDPNVLSHDPAIVSQYAKDPLNLKVASARWFTETKAAQAELLERAREIRAPFLFLVSGSDELADARASERVYHELGATEREFELLRELRHEPINEAGWEVLAGRMLAWFDRFR